MKCIDSKKIGPFEYHRYEFYSEHLGKKQTFGTLRPQGIRPQATIHYFHSGNTNDQMMLEMQLIDRLDSTTLDYLVSKKVQFVLPNFELNFLLSSNDDPKRPFSEYFFDEVLPRAERDTDTTADTRFCAGASLGGHSALVAFLKKPEFFKGVAATIGSLLNFNFYSETEFNRYVQDAGVSNDFAVNLKSIFHGFFESYEVYKKIDPMLLLEKTSKETLQGKRILIDTGSSDDFGFHIAMSDFSDALTKKGIPHQFDLVQGGRHEPAFVMSRFTPMLRFLLN